MAAGVFARALQSRVEPTCWALKALIPGDAAEHSDARAIARGLNFLAGSSTSGWLVAVHTGRKNRLLGDLAGVLGSGVRRR